MRRSKKLKNDGKLIVGTKDLLTVRWENNQVIMIDQTKLPGRLVYVKYKKYEDVARAIERLVVRGAPAIGVAAAFGFLWAVIALPPRWLARARARSRLAATTSPGGSRAGNET